jgi:phenylacetate-CoA ligase
VREQFDGYLDTLARTEWLPPRELAAYQQEQLVRLVCHARDSLPFYRDRLSCLFTSDDRIDLTHWNEVPFLTRDDVIRDGEAMRVADLSPDYGEVAEAKTSGSTGVPLKVATNGQVFFAGNALLTRTARWFGLDTTRPLATIRRFIDEPAPASAEGNSDKGWSHTSPDAPRYEFDMLAPIARQIEWLAWRNAPYLFTQPSGALAIAHAVTPEQGRALGIECVLLFGETVPEDAPMFITERLGARVAAIYSCREIGFIAGSCPSGTHYHVAAENALVEIVDDDGRDVAPGERGHVVVTGLYNYVMPFIRYRLGDIAIAGAAPCPCGRSLPVIRRIEGRTRNAFVFRDGSRIWPRGAMVRAMHPFVPFRRFQLIQHTHEEIEFRYVPDGSGRRPDPVGLNAYARQVLHPSVEMRAVEVDALMAGPSGKLDEFVSEVSLAPPPGPTSK